MKKKFFATLVILAALVAGNLAISQTNTQGTGTQRLSAAGGAGGGGGTDATVTFTDITTNNVSITKHGFAPKAPNDATQFLNGVGAYSVPGALGGFLKADGTQAMTADFNGGGNNLVNFAGITAGAMVLDSAVAVATPPTGDLGFGAGSFGSAIIPIWKNPAAVTTAMQSALWQGNFTFFMSGLGASHFALGGDIGKIGSSSVYTLGANLNTSTTPVKYFSLRKAVVSAAAGAGAQGGVGAIDATGPSFWRGNAAGLGGVFYKSRQGVELWTANNRLFWGLAQTTGSIVSADPSGVATSMFGLAMDSADTVIKLFTRDGTTATTKIVLSGVGSVTVTAGGTGCTTAPAVTFTSGGGAGAAGYATIVAGAISTVTMTSVGGAYTSAPTVGFSGGTCSGSTATANMTTMPAPTAGTATPIMVDFWIYAKPNDSTMYYRVDDVVGGVTIADGAVSANLPLNNVFLFPMVTLGNGTNAGAASAVSIVNVWCSTPQ